MVDVEGISPGEPKNKDCGLAAANTLSTILSLSCYAHATQAVLASLGAPPVFKPLQAFKLHLQEEYRGFRWDVDADADIRF